ncbi:cytidine deaminase [Glaciecola sp. 1036]|uniref:cytidine deaminase n=1 Tax=Alteromonadaceae TaxID=72275 RepID=UPI003CFBC55C
MKDPIFEQLKQTLTKAYSPYSGVQVAAAIEYEIDGESFIEYGVNVENVSYGLTQCAERNAICSAVTKGMKKITSVRLMSNQEAPLTPCGACRQVIVEFAADASTWIESKSMQDDVAWHCTVPELLPSAFVLK